MILHNGLIGPTEYGTGLYSRSKVLTSTKSEQGSFVYHSKSGCNILGQVVKVVRDLYLSF